MSLARPFLRSPALRVAARRFQSTTTEKAAEVAKNTVETAKSTAETAQTKASQGLSRVTSTAAGAARGMGNSLSKIGGRTGRLIGFIQAQTPFVVYYSRVGLEMSKLVFQGQRMSLPSVNVFQSYYQNLWNSIRSGSIVQSSRSAIQSARNISSAQLTAGGVLLAECLGFFTVGEMVGRFKLVGYHGEAGGHH